MNELLLVQPGNPDLVHAGWQYPASAPRCSYAPVLDAVAHLPDRLQHRATIANA